MTEYRRTPTKAPPKIANGVTFRCYQIGYGGITHWETDDGRVICAANGGLSTYYAAVDGENLGKRFRSLEGAMRAGVIEMALSDMRAKHPR